MAPARLCEAFVDSPQTVLLDDLSLEVDKDLLEPIAVIGFALKFPQDATTPSAFWKILEAKVNTSTEVPAGRFDIDTQYHPSKWGSLPLRGGHFLKQNIGGFDAEFFGINPSEALAMDPAQRILLETTFHAFESAGLRLEDLRGSNTSVHTGCFTADYFRQLMEDPERLPAYSAVGGTLAMLANRVSWFYDLMGTSVNLDSACSSSAMAIEQACELLRSGDAEMGIAAGCNLTLDPYLINTLSNMQFLSKDSRSYSFDSRANGYARGEGVGVVLLQPLSKALRDGNTIRAVIRSCGSNQDGRTPTITQPNSQAQTRLILETYRKAGLTKKYTRFFEAHGTGTAVGDPIEARAIADVFNNYREPDDPLYVGALKSNFGHLEGASGIAALIKTILILEKGIIVPNANFVKLNPKVSQLNSCLAFPTACIPWPTSNSSIRRASINCFGYGGSNCHIIVDDALSFLSCRGLNGRHLTSPQEVIQDFRIFRSLSTAAGQSSSQDSETMVSLPRILVWSAATETALKSVIDDWQAYVLQHQDQTFNPQNLLYTLDTRRSRMAWRSHAIIRSPRDLDTIASKVSACVYSDRAPRLTFVFTGQGAQWFAMGRELLNYGAYSDVINEAEDALEAMGCSWSVREELLRSETESRVHELEFGQPLCAILQIGLVDLLKTVGVRPHTVVGHSMGEIAAAYCIGAISRKSAFKLAYYRGVFMGMVPQRAKYAGGMTAVGLSRQAILPYFDQIKAANADFKLSLACVNSPQSVTVSGETSQLSQLEAALQMSSIFVRRLRVNAAYHSRQLECIAQDFLQELGSLESGWSSCSVRMISTVSTSVVLPGELRKPYYWIKNLLSPVEFSGAIEALSALREDAWPAEHLIEIGPHATLKLPIQQIFQDLPNANGLTYSSALSRGQDAGDTLLQMLGDLFSKGYPVDFRSFNDPGQTPSYDLRALSDGPEYPFSHDKIYWYESHYTRNQRFRGHKHVPLLGNSVPDWNSLLPQWRYCVRPAELPWLRDHRMDGRMLYPGAALVSMALSAAAQVSDPTRQVYAYDVRRVCFRSPVAPPLDSDDMETRLSMRPIDTASSSSKWSWYFDIFASQGDDWVEACTGFVEAVYTYTRGESIFLEDCRRRLSDTRHQCRDVTTATDAYCTLEACGYQFGPSFRGMQAVYHNRGGCAHTKIDLALPCASDRDHQDYVIHPASLDTFFQISLVALTSGAQQSELLHVPTSIEKLWISSSGIQAGIGHLHASVQLEEKYSRAKTYSLFALNERENEVLLKVDGFELSAINGPQPNQEQSLAAIENAFSVRTFVDVETLTPAELQVWLTHECGPDKQGQSQFWKDLRSYVLSSLPELQAKFSVARFPDDLSYLEHFLSWINWQIAQTSYTISESSRHDIEARVATQNGVGALVVEVVQNIHHVLDGKIAPLQLLFENDLIKNLYRDQTLGSVYELKLETFIRHLGMKRPRMNILEIGAGTGSFTKHILRALETNEADQHLYKEYTFTDVSPVFFNRAKQELSIHKDQMLFQRLDLNIDLVEQGYQESQYDLIVASNVLHVPSDLTATIKAVRRLLRPEGKIILHETVVPHSPEVGLAFGLIEGWWCGQESYRSMSPLLTEDRWVSLLRENGFESPDIVLRDFADPDSHHMSIICASAVDTTSLSEPDTEVMVLTKANSSAEAVLAHAVQQTLSPAKVTLMTLLEASGHELDLVVFLIDTIAPFFARLDEHDFEALKTVLSTSKRILWISGGGSSRADPAFRMIDGFIQVLRTEFAHLEISTLALEDCLISPNDALITRNSQYIAKTLHLLKTCKNSFHREDYVVQQKKLSIRRTALDTQVAQKLSDLLQNRRTSTCLVESARPFALETGTVDGKTGFETIAMSRDVSPVLGDSVEIEVWAIGVDHMDVDLLQGLAPIDALGVQGAGIVTVAGASSTLHPGDRVCFWHSGTIRSTIRIKSDHVARIPARFSFASAAILPRVSLFAFFLVATRLRLAARDSILILGPINNLSCAVIAQALSITSKVSIAVFSQEDRDMAAEWQQPIYDAQAGFDELLCQRKHFDAIIDLSSRPHLLEIFELTSRYGRIMRVEEPARKSNITHWMPRVPLNLSLFTTTMQSLFTDETEIADLSLDCALDSLFKRDSTGGIPSHNFALSQTCHLFDDLRNNIGPTVIDFGDSQEIKLVHHNNVSHHFSPDASYVISGGFGDLGRSLARWMVSRGARSLIIVSRSGPSTTDAREMVHEFENQGILIVSIQCDITDRHTLEHEIRQAQTAIPPIKGCIQTSGVLKDIMYEQMTLDDWNTAVMPKTWGSWNLHELLPNGMDFFILIASAVGIVGQATQINYAAANAYEDALANYRVAHGENALALDLGVLLTGGMISRSPDLLDRVTSSGHHIPMSEKEIWLLMDLCCDNAFQKDSSLLPQLITGIRSPARCAKTGIPPMESMRYPLWSWLRPTTSASRDPLANVEIPDAFATMKAAHSQGEANAAVVNAIIQRIATISLVDAEGLDAEQTLLGNGVDSLCAIELRNWILKVFGFEVPMFDLLGGSTVSELGCTIAASLCGGGP